MDMGQLVMLCLIGLWPVTLPAAGLLGWALSRDESKDYATFRRAFLHCVSLLVIGTVSLTICFVIRYTVHPAVWPVAAWFILIPLALQIILSIVFVARATRHRFHCLLVVLGSDLLSLALFAAMAIALGNVGT